MYGPLLDAMDVSTFQHSTDFAIKEMLLGDNLLFCDNKPCKGVLDVRSRDKLFGKLEISGFPRIGPNCCRGLLDKIFGIVFVFCCLLLSISDDLNSEDVRLLAS